MPGAFGILKMKGKHMTKYLATGMYASHRGNPIAFRFTVEAEEMDIAADAVTKRIKDRKTYAGKLSFALVRCNDTMWTDATVIKEDQHAQV